MRKTPDPVRSARLLRVGQALVTRDYRTLNPAEIKKYYRALLEYVALNPNVTFSEISDTPFRKIIYNTSGSAINDIKERAGVDERFIRRRSYSPETWCRRRKELINYVVTHPESTRNELISDPARMAAFTKFYKGFIVLLLRDANFNDENIWRFLESYYLKEAIDASKSVSQHREALGLPVMSLDDLIQEARIGIVNSIRKSNLLGKRVSRSFAFRAALYKCLGPHDSDSGHYSYVSACKIPYHMRESLDRILRGSEEPGKKKEILALSALNPIHIEYSWIRDGDSQETNEMPPESLAVIDEINIKDVQEWSMPERPYSGVSQEKLIEVLKSLKTIRGERVLNDTQLSIIKYYYGIGVTRKNLREIAELFGCSRQNVWIVMEKAIAKLKIPQTQRKIASGLELEVDVVD